MTPFVSKENLAYKNYAGQIDINKFAEMIDNPLHTKQQEIATLFMGDERKEWWYLSLLAARRFGKTRLLTVIGCAELMTPFANVGIVGKSMSVAKEFFNFINRYLKHLKTQGKIKDFRASIAELHIHIPETGSNLYIASETSYEDRIVGKSLSLLIYDESFLLEDRFFNDSFGVLVPSGANYGTYENGIPIMKVVSLSTPRNRPAATLAGRNHIKGMYANSDGYKSLKYTIYDSPFIDNAGIEALKKQMSADRFRREFMCEFAVDSTGVFPRFDSEKNVVDINFDELRKQSENLFLVTAADWGTTDANAFTMGVYNFKTDKGFILKEYFKDNTLFNDFIDLMIKEETDLMKQLNINSNNVLRFSDPAEKQGRLLAAAKGFPMHKAYNKNMEGYDLVNEAFEGKFVESVNATIPDLYISNTCIKTIQQVMSAEFKEAGGIKTNAIKRDTEHLHYDLVATVRYWTASIKKFLHKSDPILI